MKGRRVPDRLDARPDGDLRIVTEPRSTADNGLSDKVAVVTGGNAGIGQAIARSLALNGAKVVIAARRVAEGRDTVVELTVEHEDVAQSLLSILEADFVSSTHVYPITSVFTIVDGGRPTEVGLRGYPALATIIGAGASNQRQPALLRVLYGETVQGVERPQ
jgi:hypothetical protein